MCVLSCIGFSYCLHIFNDRGLIRSELSLMTAIARGRRGGNLPLLIDHQNMYNQVGTHPDSGQHYLNPSAHNGRGANEPSLVL